MRKLFIELAAGPSIKEMILMLLAVVIIGTPIAWAIEDNQVKNMNIEEIKNELIERTGFTERELEGKGEKEIEDIFNSLIVSNTKLYQIKDLFIGFNEKEIENEDINIDELKLTFQGELNNILNDKLPNGEGKILYIKGWNTILDKINSMDSIPDIFTNIFDGLMEFTLKDVFKTDFSFPKLADFI